MTPPSSYGGAALAPNPNPKYLLGLRAGKCAQLII